MIEVNRIEKIGLKYGNNEISSKKVLAVYTNEDRTEGRGEEYIRHFCRCQETAERLGKKQYVQGTDCPIKEVTVYLINDEWYGPINVKGATKEDLEKRQLNFRFNEIETALNQVKATPQELMQYIESMIVRAINQG